MQIDDALSIARVARIVCEAIPRDATDKDRALVVLAEENERLRDLPPRVPLEAPGVMPEGQALVDWAIRGGERAAAMSDAASMAFATLAEEVKRLRAELAETEKRQAMEKLWGFVYCPLCGHRLEGPTDGD